MKHETQSHKVIQCTHDKGLFVHSSAISW